MRRASPFVAALVTFVVLLTLAVLVAVGYHGGPAAIKAAGMGVVVWLAVRRRPRRGRVDLWIALCAFVTAVLVGQVAVTLVSGTPVGG